MKSRASQPLSVFDQQLTQLINNIPSRGYDIMRYEEYFNEKPPPITKQNNFADYGNSMVHNDKNSHVNSQYGINKISQTQLDGLNYNREPIDYLKPISYNNGSRHNGVNGVNTNVSGVKVNSSSPFINGQFNTTGNLKLNGFGANHVGSKIQQPVIVNLAKLNGQDANIGNGIFNTGTHNTSKVGYLQKFNHLTTQNTPIEVQYSKSPPTNPSRSYNNYMSNLTHKYGQLPNDTTNGLNASNDAFKSHLMSKKVSTK